jgi:hypothetical protein
MGYLNIIIQNPEMKFATLFIIIAIRVLFGTSGDQDRLVPFTSPGSIESVETKQPIANPAVKSIRLAKLVSFKGTVSSNKVLLQWAVNENETADQFEIQKSIDGKNFSLSALVFGTDKPETDFYQFYERVNRKKAYYRVKLINKDQQTEYSAVVEIDPAMKVPS